MARTTLDPITLPGPWSTQPVAITWTAANTTDGNQFRATGDEMLLVRNTGATAASVTVVSTPDAPFGRSGNMVMNIPAGGMVVTQVFPLLGWQQPNGYIYIDTTSTNVEFAVIRVRR